MVPGFLTTTFIRAALSTALLVFMVGCSPVKESRYAEVFDLQGQVWPGNSSVIFDYNNPSEMAEQRSQIWITSRIDKEFTGKILALEIKTVKPDKSYWCDTLLMDPARDGRPITTGVELRVMHRSMVQFVEPGKWSFSIRQLNAPQDTLRGVRAIAIELRNQ